ncbi:POTRA domain protein, FtsQ-type [Leptospira inadai serovar Lyme str. 10]|uniref:POTRA domain protein, FtsQ-type n=2 Tax=Leptospira inadai serovar Lyme TaxID=293084 RepID=V6HEI3_9LEPT|nr:FtsQ-type POTRA domain-containing protein [Leptospira inadai]EQA38796.1 POTRA domain protein, FtsQ-type [Leptospira inadai serovar Lyme str. 10]PNV74063.1 cell division protein [Leptospira inadai serovar Lyme]
MRHNLIDFLKDSIQKRTSWWLLAILALLVGSLGWGFKKGTLPQELNKLILTGHETLKTEEIVQIMGIQPGTSFENYDLSLMESRLTSHPRIKKARLEKKSDDQLFVEITERKPVYLVNSDGHLFEIDSELKVLSKDDVRTPGLTVLSGTFPREGGFVSGAAFKDLYISVENAFRSYPALKTRVSEVSLHEDGEIFVYTDAPIPVRVQIGTLFQIEQVRKLYAVLAYLEKEKVKPRLVDIRGEDAVYH